MLSGWLSQRVFASGIFLTYDTGNNGLKNSQKPVTLLSVSYLGGPGLATGLTETNEPSRCQKGGMVYAVELFACFCLVADWFAISSEPGQRNAQPAGRCCCVGAVRTACITGL